VILVDADLHRPTQMKRFELPNRSGLSTLLLNSSIGLESLLRDTSVPGLRVLTSGPAPAAPSALYTSNRLAARLEELQAACDVLVLDTPPVLAQPDATLLGQHIDGVVFVIDARKSRGRQVRRALELLNEAGVVVLGAAFNRVPPRAMDYIPYSDVQHENVQAEETAATSTAATSPVQGRAT
jgi:capsular exopolysaccharide synthesis family protein